MEKVLQLRVQHSEEKIGAARIDDTHLIRGAQLGDSAAFEELVRQYDRPVLRLAIHLTGSQEDARDIYQEAFLRAFINIGSFRFECSFYTWIYRIVTNLCLDHLRKRSSRHRDVTTAISSDGEEEQVLDRIPDQRARSDLHGRCLRGPGPERAGRCDRGNRAGVRR